MERNAEGILPQSSADPSITSASKASFGSHSSHSMRLHILTIGKPRLAFARAGVEEYVARLSARGGVQIETIKAGTREQESEALLARSEGMFRVVLDERGEQVTSRAFAQKLSQWELQRTKAAAFLIGGADGHSDELRRQADWQWALGKLTLQHELALVVLLEQLYRARCINSGAPYHRD
jgi:23S rRNA (pseudouridine1915-N3)-methyltransferase